MAHRIDKEQLKQARVALETFRRGGDSQEKSRMLTAAAVLGLVEHADRIEWIQEPPPDTVLEFQGDNVRLTFEPDPLLCIKRDPGSRDLQQARRILAGRDELVLPLQIVGLAALEANIRWKAAPLFRETEP